MMKIQRKAFLFDLNGTMINDMEYHIQAWYELVNDQLNAGLSREAVKEQMYGKNEEVMLRIFGEGHFTMEQMHRMSLEKERKYQEVYKPHLELIPGLSGFLQSASEKGILMAIGSAAIPFNIDFVLDNLQIRHYFSAIVSADDVVASKPDPETYLKAAAQLQVEKNNCIVFEDAPKGVESAMRASMNCVVLTTMHKAEEFVQYPNILHFVEDYNDPFLGTILS
jgi:beta-phosphoglucomutase